MTAKEFTLDDMLRLGAENSRLKAAIQKHRDQRGDDRCYLDDAELYEAAGLQPANTALPPKEVFLGNCARFHASRQAPGDKYVTVEEQLAPMEDLARSLYAYCSWDDELPEGLKKKLREVLGPDGKWGPKP